VTDITYPSSTELRDQILRTIAVLYARRGLTANILPNSEHWVRAEAFARRLSIAIANGQLGIRRFSPLDAVGQDLLDLCAVFGIFPRPAEFGTGFVTVDGTGTFTIPEDFVGTAPTGAKFKTTEPNPAIEAGASVAVVALTAGTGGNLAAGTIVTWDSGEVGALKNKAVVAAGGITGGAPADDEERLRDRLLRKLADPSVGGNAAQIREWAEASSASIAAAYVYSAARGPGSYDVALVGSADDGVLTSATCTSVEAYIAGQMPGHANVNVTSITNELVDVVVAAQLPLPVTAGGAGGGWRDAEPWPTADAQVTGYMGPSVVFLTCTVAPTVGRNIAIWDPDAAQLREYTITAVSGAGPSYDVTVQGGFGFDPTGAYVSAGAVNLTSYFDTLVESFLEIGPGEKSESPDVMPRARRRPATDVEAPSDVTNLALGALTSTYPEVLDAAYALRVESGTATPRTSPSIPPTTADPPRRLRVRHLAIRKA
jgi:uncharacterized phage protein gp47/JayE